MQVAHLISEQSAIGMGTTPKQRAAQLLALPPMEARRGGLEDVCGWLVINAMRTERVQFEFVAVIPDKDIGAVEGSLGKLTFDSLKAISYPGGARMATFTACELDSLSDACDGEQEKFISK